MPGGYGAGPWSNQGPHNMGKFSATSQAGSPLANNPGYNQQSQNLLSNALAKANAPKQDYTSQSITQQRAGYQPKTVGPLEMATAAGKFAGTDYMTDKWANKNTKPVTLMNPVKFGGGVAGVGGMDPYGQWTGGKLAALQQDPSIVNTMKQAKANLADWNATTGQKLGYPLGMNTLGGVKPTTDLMLDRALNVGAGVNPTTGMGLMDSLKSNAYVGKGQFSLPGLISGIAGTAIGGPISGILAGNLLPKLFKKEEDSYFNAWGMPSEFDTDEGLHVAEYTPDPLEEGKYPFFGGLETGQPGVGNVIEDPMGGLEDFADTLRDALGNSMDWLNPEVPPTDPNDAFLNAYTDLDQFTKDLAERNAGDPKLVDPNLTNNLINSILGTGVPNAAELNTTTSIGDTFMMPETSGLLGTEHYGTMPNVTKAPIDQAFDEVGAMTDLFGNPVMSNIRSFDPNINVSSLGTADTDTPFSGQVGFESPYGPMNMLGVNLANLMQNWGSP